MNHASNEQVTVRSALILYGTETGNAQDAAEEAGRTVERLHFSVRVAELDEASLKDLLQYDIVVLIISTTGQGELPANAQRFWRLLRSARLKPGSLSRLRFTSFGLGDSSYPQFNYAHRKLHNRLAQLGAQLVVERGESDEQHPEGIDGTFIPWLLALRHQLLESFPLPDGLAPIAENVMLPLKWELQQMESSPRGLSNGLPFETGQVGVDAFSPDLLPVRGSITTTVQSNHRLTPSEHWQDVRLLTLTSYSELAYMPGDTLTIYPKNIVPDVDQFLDLYDWTAIADSPLQLRQGSDGQDLTNASPLRHLDLSAPLTLRYLLTNVLDIMAIPRRSFFARLAHYTADEFQRDRLLEFINPEYVDELYDYTTRPRRSILEVLQEFNTVKLPWQAILEILPIMRGRQFSIASGGTLKQATNLGHGTRFELLVAIVKYRTVIRRIREGVCTRYIATLQPGQKINVKLQKGGLAITEKDIGRPVLLIGPGTGVAPMRALIYQRLASRESQQTTAEKPKSGKDLLFFGCRNEECDYFFRDEWAALQERGILDVVPAFSRDQRQKVYVQDLVRERSADVYRALQWGIVYVCGSSGKMPQAVREALIAVFEKEGSLDRAGAEAALAQMEKEKRYKQETW